MLKTEYEYLSSNAWINFPFVDGPDVSPEGFQAVIVDAAVTYVGAIEQPLKLSTVDLLNYHIRILYEDNTVFFDDAVDGTLITNNLFGSYRILEWRNSNYTKRVLLTVNEEVRENFTYPVTVGNGTFLDRVVMTDLPAVRRINVQYNSEVDPDNTVWIDGDVKLQNGINTAVNLEGSINPGPRETTVVRLDSGSGLGDSPDSLCEEQEATIKTINGQGPDNQGNFILEPKDCVWWSAPWETYSIIYNPMTQQFEQVPINEDPYGARHLKLHSDCDPCCSCEDYEDVYRVTLRQNRRLKQLCDNLITLRERAKVRFEQVRQRIQNVQKFVLRMQTADCRGWQMCVSILLINSTRHPITGQLSVTHDLGEMQPIVEPPSFRVYDGRGGYNKWRFVPEDLSKTFEVQNGSFVLIQGCYRMLPDLSLKGKTGHWQATFVSNAGTFVSEPAAYLIEGNVNKSNYEPSSWQFKYNSWWSKQSLSSWSWYQNQSETP